MKLLLLAGKAGSGKDTAANIICNRFPAVSVAMADPLKDLAKAAFKFSTEQLWGPSETRNEIDERSFSGARFWDEAEDIIAGAMGIGWLRECGRVVHDFDVEKTHLALQRWFYRLRQVREVNGVSPRVVLQTLGTEFGRSAMGPNVWVDLAVMHGLIQAEAGGKMFAVITDGRFSNEVERVRARHGRALQLVNPEQAETSFSGHASERGLEGVEFDAVIENDKHKGLRELERQLIAAILFLKGVP